MQSLSAKDCVARIYRDIRFSKDKSPYKTNRAAIIAPGGWKARDFPAKLVSACRAMKPFLNYLTAVARKVSCRRSSCSMASDRKLGRSRPTG